MLDRYTFTHKGFDECGEPYAETMIVREAEDEDIFRTIEIFKEFLVACGYSPVTIEKALPEIA